MSTMVVDGVRMDYIRKCWCGRRPKVATAYEGFEPGMGPFIISCYCDTPKDAKDVWGFRPGLSFVRSWSKTRAVRNWNAMVRDRSLPAPLMTGRE
jgi:hypothetical protein